MEKNFELGGIKFQLGKLDAFKQFHVVRRVGPLLSEIVTAAKDIGSVKIDGMTEEQKLDHFSKLAAPFMNGLSKLSDADSDYVLLRLLSVVEVNQEKFGTWAKVAVDDRIMIELELPVMLGCAGRALMYNLSGFFASLPQK